MPRIQQKNTPQRAMTMPKGNGGTLNWLKSPASNATVLGASIASTGANILHNNYITRSFFSSRSENRNNSTDSSLDTEAVVNTLLLAGGLTTIGLIAYFLIEHQRSKRSDQEAKNTSRGAPQTA